MLVDEMLARMTSAQLTEYLAFFDIQADETAMPDKTTARSPEAASAQLRSYFGA